MYAGRDIAECNHVFDRSPKDEWPLKELLRTAKMTLGNGVRESILSPNYVAFPDKAMKRFAQERGFLRHQKIGKVHKPVVVCQGAVCQVTTAVTANVPTRDLVSREDCEKKELMELAKLQKKKQELLVEPTTLGGAIQELNLKNDGRLKAAQRRLKHRGAAVLDRSDSSVEFIVKAKGDPEKERREKPVVRLTPPVVSSVATPPVAAPRQAVALPSAVVQAADASVDVLDEDGDSDDPDRDRIIVQRLRVKLEMDRLARYESEYAAKRENGMCVRVHQP